MSILYLSYTLILVNTMSMLDRIKGLAKKRGLTCREIEEKCGLGKNSIYRWDKSWPSADKLNAVANLLDCSMDYLYSGEEHSSLSIEDQELLEIFHSLPPETQRDFLGAMRIHAELHDLVDKDDEPEENDLKQAK